MLTHIYMVVYTWWCWHIYKGGEVGVDVDQLGDETKVKGETPPAECLPVECGQSNGATGALHKKDRVSQSASDASRARPVRLTQGDAGAGV